ncbi:CxC2 domain-containing protein [Mycena chlorophos]|uniref:CxC2 domain-containing protein n=1 Tax=Mycena chlorophos TaxID=658473 RepID=A0A8H6WJN6_MYCCL|nr:CxC2 domain-containing protein [Mycena chlorophos]
MFRHSFRPPCFITLLLAVSSMAGVIRNKAPKARKASAAFSSTHEEFSVDQFLYQPEAPAFFHDQSVRVSVSSRRKRTDNVPVELPSPMKPAKRARRHSISVIDTATFSLEEDFYQMDLEEVQHVVKKPIRPSDPVLREWALGARSIAPSAIPKDAPPCTDATTAARDGFSAASAVSKHTPGFLSILSSANFHFSKTNLKSLGLRVQVGHPAPDVCCPHPRPAPDEFVVLHDNGIHQLAIDYCGCVGAEAEYLQLLRSRFFPATTKRPQTCATFSCLDRYNAFSLKPRTNGWDFYDTLERLTDGAGNKPPDRYRMLLRMGREWRHLHLLKRGGVFGYETNSAEDTAPGALAISCPACPRPGVNLPDNWQDAEPRDRCLYSQFFAMDACFQLKRRMVSSEARDPALGPGFAFTVDSKPYREYLRKTTNKQEMSTCSGLKALATANTKFSKGYAATGVGMVVCARHEVVQPTSVGDLQKGERYCNMDYIFASMVQHTSEALRKVVSYDIVCQWNRNLFKRLAELPNYLKIVLPPQLTRFVVPKLHILGHTLDCKGKYDLNLVPGSGQTDAEGIERAWASAGGLSGSTKMMGPGARSDMLDAYWSFWNWTKVLGLPALLRQRLNTAKTELENQIEALDLFTEQQEDLVPAWRQMVLEFEADGSKPNPYVVKTQGMTEAQVRLKLRQAEEAQAAEGRVPLRVRDVGPVGFLEFALAVELQQRRVKAQATLKKSSSTAEEINIGASRQKLNRDQETLRSLQATFTPEALTKLAALELPNSTLAEEVPLFLPSALAASWSKDPVRGLDAIRSQLLAMERELRCAQMGTALANVRCHLHLKYKFLLEKELHVRHQAANTRARTTLARNESQLMLFADLYQIAWFAVLQIEGGDESKVGFKRLQREDIRYMSDAEVHSKKMEQTRLREQRQAQRMARIREEEGDWNEDEMAVDAPGAQPDPEEDDEFFMNGSNKTKVPLNFSARLHANFELAIRIEWCKAWARVRRWDEEVRMVKEETRRVPVSHDEWAAVWKERAKRVPVGSIPEQEAEGMVAYGLKQAAMHLRLAAQARKTAAAPKLGRGRRRVHWVPAPVDLLAVEDEEEAAEDDEREDLEAIEERGDWDGDEEVW